MTFVLEIIRLGIKNLGLHKLRSSLTSLGIILGVAAVIIVVSIGEGNKQSTLRQITNLGATNIIIRSQKPPSNQSASNRTSLVVEYGITRLDLERLEHFIGPTGRTDSQDPVDTRFRLRGKHLVPLKAVGNEIRRRNERTISQVFGTTPELLETANLTVRPGGRYLVPADMEASAPVAVIGSEIADAFFRLEDPVGKELWIDSQVLKVVGVLEPIGLAGGAGVALVGRDLNKDVHIPISTAKRNFGDIVTRRESGSFSGEDVKISEIYLQAEDTDEVIDLARLATRILELDHPTFRDVQVIVPYELLQNAKRTMLIWNIMLVSVAAISLLVGGIGIMNIMLASVVERTREIGIRRALGATRNHIIAQFLVETGSISSLGGVLGIVLGVGISLGLSSFIEVLLAFPLFRELVQGEFKLEPVIVPWSIWSSLLVAVGVGLVFGIYPAIIASRKDPIDALRHD
ncbi:MAG: ABC transporter ATP-binding protein [Planctomycetaceae bacterium]|nr:ABC transporter ATP-binding protein [Planctomycetaceae bacterium]